MKTHILTFIKGMAMGIAEIIPGVSGGTIAFITGIYETLLDSIRAFRPALFTTLKEKGIKGVWEEVNGTFLVTLLGGMGLSIVLFIGVITYLLENNKELLWGFFFGLIVASAVFIGRQVEKWDATSIALILFGTALAYYITVAAPSQGNEALWFVFLSGAIAISALILPGISGSFILLLMGMYTFIIPTVSEALRTFATDKLIIVGVFAMGCLTGLLTFANLLSWTFKNYKNQTLAILTGFMIGSLNKVWPWRNVLSTRINSKGDEVPFIEQSVLPSAYGGETYMLGVIALMVVGFVVVFALERLDTSEPS